jgi:tungstate transport system substrate-binding protein
MACPGEGLRKAFPGPPPWPGVLPAQARGALLLAALLLPTLAGCTGPERSLVLATTTSTDNTGLLAWLLPAFEQAHGARVKVVAVGTGRALELGRAGDADVVLAHAPETERAYLANGSFQARHEVMYNHFLLVGPAHDPAGLRGAANVTEAFRLLHQRGAPFVSRGDASGTHLREQALWAQAGLDYHRDVAAPGNAWYRSVGQGMEATLRVASEQRAYCLTDDGTFAKAAAPGLVAVRSNEPPLRNQYSVLVPNATRVAAPQHDLAVAFAAWLTGPEGQERIGAFEVRGLQLFTPNAGLVERA